MPELPEVEVTRLGIKPHLEGRQITHVDVIDGRLRWPVLRGLPKILMGQWLDTIERRGKYLLLKMTNGISVKAFLLAGQAVVGVGNIYCSESLFEAGIHPGVSAGKLTKAQCERLAHAVRTILKRAIAAGGSSLRDFVDAHGEPGYFMMQTKVYDRANEPCRVCKTPIRQITQNQRSTYYCPQCQKR
ncbi:MAG: hypothetical protein EBY97_00695 [Burkholderiaceae bacterium]|nr:hypothetical protein [Burkholderiaceae bacterium]